MTTFTAPRPTPRSTGLPPTLHYALKSAALTAKNVSFVVFTVVMPVTLYLVFSAIYGGESDDGLASAMIMVSMAAYGSLGAAMSGGAQLALERRSGWFRQLMITSVPPRVFLWARAAVTMTLVLPALILVFVAGAFLGGVTATAGQWLASLGLLWIGLLPMTVLGMVVGVWVKAEAVQGVTTMLLLALSLLGGLWFPVDNMPPVMATIAPVLPTYWLGELGRFPFLPGADFPWGGIGVLLAWSVGLTVLGALGYRRAAATSKR
ncbi:ABC transporter permease [Microbacterium sp. 2FI]|uniref:ABC transporter permease n=1 Tax=Microbacterium sp. 2FI TaxID=2502193 RepID=UPI0010F55A2F|nr:ABC transporter permease [Microbacterium sp. 2FI]